MTIEKSVNSLGSDRTLARTLLNALKAATDTTLKVGENDVALHAEIQDLTHENKLATSDLKRQIMLRQRLS
jgi:hypothetical protein